MIGARADFENVPIERRKVGLTRAGGVVAALPPKGSRGDAVSVRSSFRNGTVNTWMGRSTAAAASIVLAPDDLLAAMRRPIGPEMIAIFRAGDFANDPTQ